MSNTPSPAPKWVETLRPWLRQTSTRSGLIFAIPAALGYALNPDQAALIAAIAGAVAALFAVIYPDKPPAP